MTNDDERAPDDLPRAWLEQWSVPEMPTDMKERVMAQVHEQWNMGAPTPVYGTPPRPTVAVFAAMLAAGVAVLASGTAVFFAMRPQPALPVPQVASPPAPIVASAPPAATLRTLTVETTPPDARVELDGKSLTGLSPFVTSGLALGSHEIRVRREGHADWIRVVQLGTEDLHLVVALKELPVPTAIVDEETPVESSIADGELDESREPFGGRPAPLVRQAAATVKGALDKDVIRRIVRAHINEARACYNQGLVRDPSLAGRVVIQFTIGPSGAVPAAVVQASTLSDAKVGQCIAKAAKRWKFPKPDGGGNVVVTYPFVLGPG